MLKFSGNKSLKTIKNAVLKRGWFWDQSRFDNGSDYVTFDFGHEVGNMIWWYRIVYNTFNGKFIVLDDGDTVTESSTEYDNVEWYKALLKFIYKPLTKAVLAKATGEQR